MELPKTAFRLMAPAALARRSLCRGSCPGLIGQDMDEQFSADVAGATAMSKQERFSGGAPFHHVAVLADNSEHALHALRHAVQMATLFNARLDVALIENGSPGSGEALDLFGHNAADRLALKQALIARITNRAGVQARPTILDGHTSKAILEFVRDRGCDLLVIGATTAHSIYDQLWGSRSEQIARDGICSVLVVRSAPNG